jgi:hypothetical protein
MMRTLTGVALVAFTVAGVATVVVQKDIIVSGGMTTGLGC